MIYTIGYTRYLLIAVLCFNYAQTVASQNPVKTGSFPVLSFANTAALKGLNGLKSGVLYTPKITSKLLRNSFDKVVEVSVGGCRIIINNTKESSVVLAAIVSCVALWWHREAIKKSYDSEWIYTKMTETGTSLEAKVDTELDKLPLSWQALPKLFKTIAAWMCRKLISMEGEYPVMAALCPIIGYVNSYTPLAFLGGVKVGCAFSGALLAKGYLSIDTNIVRGDIREMQKLIGEQGKQLNEKLDQGFNQTNNKLKQIDNVNKQISSKVDKVEETVQEESKKVLDKINNLEKNITTVNQELMLKMTSTEQIVLSLNGELRTIVEDIRKLPSQEDNKKVIDSALAIVVEKFDVLLKGSIKNLDEQRIKELKLLTKNIENINDQNNSTQQEKMAAVEKNLTEVLNKQELEMKKLTDTVGVTNFNITELKDYFGKCDEKFTKTQEALQTSVERCSELLEAKNQGWKAFETNIANLVEGFGSRLTNMEEKIATHDGKIEKIGNEINSLKTQSNFQHDTVLTQISLQNQQLQAYAKSLENKLKEMKEARNEQEKNMQQQFEVWKKEQERIMHEQTKIIQAQTSKIELLSKDFGKTAQGLKDGQFEILNAVKNGGYLAAQITNLDPRAQSSYKAIQHPIVNKEYITKKKPKQEKDLLKELFLSVGPNDSLDALKQFSNSGNYT